MGITPSANTPDETVLLRYVAGQSTPNEVALVRAWAGQAPEHAAMLREVSAVWIVGGSPVPSGDVRRFASALQARIEAEATQAQKHLAGRVLGRETLRGRPLFHIGIGIVTAGMMAALAVGERFLQRTSANIQHTGQTYTTRVGQCLTVTLNDGTRVTLAPSTTVRVAYDTRYGRIITLNGQGYFEVTQTMANPLIVRAGAVNARVLGTAFDVKHYSNRTVQIAVMTGKVAVYTARQLHPLATISAGQLFHMTDSSAAVTTVDAIHEYGTWTQGTLVFHGTSVPDMLQTVGRWYGYEFQLADSSLIHQHVNAELQFGSSAIMLRALQQMLGVDMTIRGRLVTLSPAPHPVTLPPARRRVDPSLSTSTEIGR